MKKIMFVAVLLILSSICLDSRPAFVPKGASWRIDLAGGGPEQVCDWYEVSHFYDENGNDAWGQGQCSMSGNKCHCWDWLTWWFGIAWVPDPPEGYTSIYGTGEIPIYNPLTHKYE